jgi:hypothetical protein
MKIHGKDINVDGRLIRIARLAAEKYEFLSDPAPTIDALQRQRTRVDLFSFLQPASQPAPQFAYPFEWDNLAALPITTFEDWWTKQINGKTRNMIRRAEKAGLVTRETDFDDRLVEGISAIYNETPTRQGRAFWHYGKNLEAVRVENGTFLDRSVFIGAFAGSTLVGFAKLVADERREQAALMQILSMIQYRDKAPTNALIAGAVRACAERGIPNLVYANFSYGKKRDTLADFKQHNGFRQVDVPRYYVPLTLAGRAALRLGLHHNLADRIPETILARLRSIRRAWHHQPMIAARESL